MKSNNYSVDHKFKWSIKETKPARKFAEHEVVMDIAQLYKIGGIKVIRSIVIKDIADTALLLTHSGFAFRVNHKIFSGVNCFEMSRRHHLNDTMRIAFNNRYRMIINYYEAVANEYIANGIIRV